MAEESPTVEGQLRGQEETYTASTPPVPMDNQVFSGIDATLGEVVNYPTGDSDTNFIHDDAADDISLDEHLSQEADDSSRPATSSHMPSQSAQARLSRTSYGITSGTSTSGDSVENDSVLITELRGAQDERAPAGPKEWAGILGRRDTEKEVHEALDGEEDEDCDTDLEIEDEPAAEEAEEHDLTGRTSYLRVCEELGVVPASYFSRHLTDTEISMKYHGLGPAGARAVATVLKKNITLEKINLSGNWMEAEGGFFMSRTLLENDYITSLNLSDNKLGKMGAYHMCKMLLVNSTLRYLDLSGNDFGDSEADYFAEVLEENKFLKELILSNNRFGEKGGEILGPAIGANDVLDLLDLSWNQIRRQGAVAVAKGVKENVRLKTCNLSWNGFGPEGGKALADAVSTNDSLMELDITGNRLDIDAGYHMAKALKVNEYLRTLKMGNNPISTAGAIALVTALNGNDSSVLVYLDLADIPVEFEFLKIIEELHRKRQFRGLHGPVLRSGNTSEDLGSLGVDPSSVNDPLILLRQHIVVNDTRIVDLLQSQDKDKTMSVTMEKFVEAMQELGVPYDKSQLEEIAKKLDKNNDGKVFYGDLVQQMGESLANGSKPNSASRPKSNSSNKSATSKSPLKQMRQSNGSLSDSSSAINPQRALSSSSREGDGGGVRGLQATHQQGAADSVGKMGYSKNEITVGH